MFNAIGRTVGMAFVAASIFAVGQATSAPITGGQVTASLPPLSTPTAVHGDARPMAAWTVFCRSYAEECRVDPGEPAEIALTPRTWQLIATVNRRVNAAIKPMTDQAHWGVADRWDLAEDGYGDCEDYQLVKRKQLAEAGLPRRAMRMTVVIDDQGEGHAVLTIRTDRGDFVLDNKRDAVLAWFDTGYTFVKRESAETIAWVSLGGATSPTTTANR